MKTEVKFEIGDVVELKSGGPRMTVGRVYEDSARCGWFVGGEACHEEFALAMLKQSWA